MKKRFLHRWFSICSAHHEHNDDCTVCDTGSWVFMPTYWLEHMLWKLSPKLWMWWSNRGDTKKPFKEKFRSRKTGEKVDPFPNL